MSKLFLPSFDSEYATPIYEDTSNELLLNRTFAL